MAFYTVLGATGKVGGATAKSLLEDNQRVRVVVRDRSKFESTTKTWSNTHLLEVVDGNFEDAESLTKALTGAAGVFIMTPPLQDQNDMRAHHRLIINNLLKGIKESKVPRVVYLSSIGAHRTTGTGPILKLHDLEEAFFQLDVSTASLRAAYFFENYRGAAPYAKQSGAYPSFLNPGTLEIPMIATADIGEAAVKYLKESWSGHRIIDVVYGDKRAYTPDDITKDLSTFYGRPVVANFVPSESYGEIFKSFGLSAGAAEFTAEMQRGFNAKWIIYEGDTEKYYGKYSFLDVLKTL